MHSGKVCLNFIRAAAANLECTAGAAKLHRDFVELHLATDGRIAALRDKLRLLQTANLCCIFRHRKVAVKTLSISESRCLKGAQR